MTEERDNATWKMDLYERIVEDMDSFDPLFFLEGEGMLTVHECRQWLKEGRDEAWDWLEGVISSACDIVYESADKSVSEAEDARLLRKYQKIINSSKTVSEHVRLFFRYAYEKRLLGVVSEYDASEYLSSHLDDYGVNAFGMRNVLYELWKLGVLEVSGRFICPDTNENYDIEIITYKNGDPFELLYEACPYCDKNHVSLFSDYDVYYSISDDFLKRYT
jgi:hypothetical protein